MPRRNLFKVPMRKTAVSVPVDYYDRIADLGDDNFSRGIRLLADMSPLADPVAHEQVTQIGDGDYNAGLALLLNAYKPSAD